MYSTRLTEKYDESHLSGHEGSESIDYDHDDVHNGGTA